MRCHRIWQLSPLHEMSNQNLFSEKNISLLSAKFAQKVVKFKYGKGYLGTCKYDTLRWVSEVCGHLAPCQEDRCDVVKHWGATTLCNTV